MSAPATVLIVDDHPVVRAGLRAALAATNPAETGPRIVVVGEASTGEGAVEASMRLRPDVVLCDLRLGSGIDGIETTRRLRRLDPAPAVLILTTFDTPVEVVRAVEAGAAGYLLKDAEPERIAAAITAVAAGGTALPPGIVDRIRQAMSTPRLTPREVEVMRLLATGATNADIATTLFVTEATVKSHLVRIFTKLDVDNRSRAVVVAREAGII